MSERHENRISRLAALSTVKRSINADAALPGQVFVGDWSAFLFCESDQIFSPSFIEVVTALISVEGATSCCLLNLSTTIAAGNEVADAMYFEADASGAKYQAQLRRGGAKHEWRYMMDSYGCASDKGNWIIYCEKVNDVAVIAFRSSDWENEFGPAIVELYAEPIASLLQHPSLNRDPFNALTEEWKDGLLLNYANH